MPKTKQEAADYLGISVRTLMRLTGSDIAHLPKRRPTDPTLYDETELSRYKADLENMTRYVSPVVTPDTPSPSQALQTRQSIALRQMLLDALQGLPSPGKGSPVQVSIADKLMLSVVEAAQLAGVSSNHIREAIKAGKLKARIIGRGYRVKRPDLDEYVKKL
jgi:excisionase family DNA binding protein